MLKRIAKELCPPILWRTLKPRYTFSGNFKTFADALAASDGYEDPAIAEQAVSHFLRRDPKLDEYAIQLIAAFSQVKGPLRVLDIGGAGGHFYFPLARHLPYVLDWTVLDTPVMVEAFKKVETRIQYVTKPDGDYDLALISGALQYMPEPYVFLAEHAHRFKHLIVNRAPLIDADRITVQRALIYGRTYPAWFFSRERFMQALKDIGTVRMTWSQELAEFGLKGHCVSHCGFLITR